MNSTRLTARSFTRSKGFTSTRTSASPISKAHSNFSCANFSVPEPESNFARTIFHSPSRALKCMCDQKRLRAGSDGLKLGSGGVHPAVLAAINKARGDKAYDREKWSGYAFGLGM